MPYIPKEQRKKYDGLIDSLANQLNDLVDYVKLSGTLKDILLRLAKSLCNPKIGGERCYARMAVVLSALNESKNEFRRRIMDSYNTDTHLWPLVADVDNRHIYNQLIDLLASELNLLDNDTLSGELNYVLFRLAKLLCCGKLNTKAIGIEIAMEYTQTCFRQEILVPYEDEKIKLAGDIK